MTTRVHAVSILVELVASVTGMDSAAMRISTTTTTKTSKTTTTA